LRFFNLSRRRVCGLLISLFFGTHGVAADGTVPIAELIRRMPLGSREALTGSQFAAYVASMNSRQREEAILKELLEGNLPSFLRNLVPVALRYQRPNGKLLTATIFVMPEYLAIGSDKDFLRIPMDFYTASAVASKLGFLLPTRKMVDAIYRQSAFHLTPEPMPAGPQMRSTEYYRIHNEKIEEQSRTLGITPGALVSGHKKDVVITNRLARNPGRIAIYGWHRSDGAPIQPLSTAHGTRYADYSHGIRLVSETVLVEGRARSLYDVLQDPVLSGVLSDEGPIPNLHELIMRTAGNPVEDQPYFTVFAQRNPR
jgi:hypothetical protein